MFNKPQTNRIRRTLNLLAILLCLLAFPTLPIRAQQQSAQQPEPRPQLVVGIGHRKNLFAVAFSPDGSTVASGGLDKTVKLWDARTGQLKQTISGFRTFIDKIEFAPDGKNLKVQGNEAGVGEYVICDLQTGALTPFDSLLQSACPSGFTAEAGRSPDGKLAVCRILRPEERGKPYMSPKAYFLALWDVQANKLMSQLDSHVSGGCDAEFSPDGKTVITYYPYYEPGVRLWDTQTGQLVKEVKGRVFTSFSPDGQTIILLNDNSLELWDGRLQTRKSIVNGRSWQPAISPDSQAIAVAGENGEITLLDAPSGKIRGELAGAGKIINLAFSNDGTTLSSLTQNGVAQSWDARTGKLKMTLDAVGRIKPDRQTPLPVRNPDAAKNGLEFSRVAFSPDGQVIASILVSSVIIWDLRTGQIHQTRSENRTDRSAEFAAEGNIIEINGDLGFLSKGGAIAAIWDMRILHPKVLSKSDIKTTLASSVIEKLRSPDDRTLVKLNHALNSAQLFDAQTGKQLGPSFKHGGAVSSFAFSPDGKFLLSASGEPELGINWNALVLGNKPSLKVKSSPKTVADTPISDATVKLWDARTGQLKQTIHCGGKIRALSFLPEQTRIVTAQIEAADDESKSSPFPIKIVKVWDISSGKPIKTIKGDDVFLSPDGRLALRIGREINAVNVWDTLSGEIKWTLTETSVNLYGPNFSPDGKLIVTHTMSDDTRSLKLWDAQTGKLKVTLPDVGGFKSFSPDGKLLIASIGGGASAWNIETGKQVWHLMMQENLLSHASFSPDGRLMAVVDNDHTIKLREAHTGQTLLTLATFLTDTPNRFEWIAFTPEGYYSASRGAARYIRWRVGDKLLPAETYAKEFNRPDLVQQALRLK